MLHYDQRSRRFVGTRYLVSADAFLSRMRRLCQADQHIPGALDYLRDEESWSLAHTGVAPIFTAETVTAEAESLLAASRHRVRRNRR